MKQISILLLLLIVSKSFSQNKFKKGYIIDLEGNKIICSILDKGALNTPEKFTYVIENNKEKEQIIASKNIQEIFFEPSNKYVRHTVDLDESNDYQNELTTVKNITLKKKSVLLKLILEGEISFWEYTNPKYKRYFFSKNEKIEFLQFKKFKNSSNQINTNNYYQTQLKNAFDCVGLDYNIRYTSKELSKFFKRYFSCKNITYKDFTITNNSSFIQNFNLKGKIGTGFFNSKTNNSNLKSSFNSNSALKIGFELEYLLNFNNNKWSLYIDPSYQTEYSAVSKVDTGETVWGGSGVGEVPIFDEDKIHYNIIEIPLGIRHYMYVNNKDAIYLNVAAHLDILFDEFITKVENQDTTSSMSSVGFGFGAGYTFSEKFLIELNYQTITKNVFEGNDKIDNIQISNVSLKLGYILF